ncbi:hypothetical protein KDU71_07505 [Carboxylicivirga sediminis]|uniref:A1 protein n=1 Tax=Carboxylicivirga sediminis TaxID=2006564 RepID=A0A941F2X1_9BACT|nr:hypothetical protein [Carboxylicivirga sediminis]MBR8535402.1 hypothetical protein [Carboxylicivirga sediminis]
MITEDLIQEALKLPRRGRVALQKHFNLTQSQARKLAIILTDREQQTLKTSHQATTSSIIDKREVSKIISNQSLLHQQKVDIISQKYQISKKEVQGWMSEMGVEVKNKQFAKAKHRHLFKTNRYIVTSAQNDTTTNIEFLDNIKALAKHVKAEIIVIPTRYKNPTAVEAKMHYDWDQRLDNYLYAQKIELHKNLVVAGDLKIQATTAIPTSRIELIGGGKSVIVGAPRIELRSLPVFPQMQNVYLHSTGTVSDINMSDTVAGGVAAAHHSYGFVFVDIENEDIVYTHNVSAEKDGSFTLFNLHVSNSEISQVDIPWLFMGDSHLAQIDKEITRQHRQIIKQFRIKHVALNDIFDSSSANVHHKDVVDRFRNYIEGKSNIKEELKAMIDELTWFSLNVKETYVIRSNHDDMLDRTIRKTDFSSVSENALIMAELLHTLLKGQEDENFKGLIPSIINKRFENVIGLGINDILEYKGVYMQHGHVGANGSKGSITSYSKLPFKTLIAHSHTPSIKGGSYQVGLACKMEHGYNEGLTSWAFCSALISAQGKRQLILFNKHSKKFTTLFN